MSNIPTVKLTLFEDLYSTIYSTHVYHYIDGAFLNIPELTEMAFTEEEAQQTIKNMEEEFTEDGYVVIITYQKGLPMTNKQFQKFYRDLLAKENSLIQAKGQEYAHSSNRFKNFEEAAMLQLDGSTRATSAWNMMTKHLVAVKHGLEQHLENKSPDSLFWREKLGDIRIYCALLEAMLQEEHDKKEAHLAKKYTEATHKGK